MNEFDMNAASQPKPGRALRRWGVVLMVLGILLGVPVVAGSGWVFYQSVAQEMLVRGLVPGTLTFTVDEPGNYVVFYEYESYVDGKHISTSRMPPQFDMTLEDEHGNEVTIVPYPYDYNYERPAYMGTALYWFNADQTGDYTLAAETDIAGEFAIAIGRDYVGYVVGGILGMLSSCMFFLLFLVGLILLIVGLVTRKGPPVHPGAVPPQPRAY